DGEDGVPDGRAQRGPGDAHPDQRDHLRRREGRGGGEGSRHRLGEGQDAAGAALRAPRGAGAAAPGRGAGLNPARGAGSNPARGAGSNPARGGTVMRLNRWTALCLVVVATWSLSVEARPVSAQARDVAGMITEIKI